MAHSPPCKWGQDVVIVAKLPTCVTQMAIDRLQRFVEPRLIHVVTTSRAKCEVFRGMSSRVRCYAEDEVVEGMTFEGVRVWCLVNHGMGGREVGGACVFANVCITRVRW